QLPEATREAVRRASHVRRIESGVVFQDIGAEPEAVFILLSGSACAQINDATGESFLLDILREGAVLNATPLFDDPTSTFQASARTEVSAAQLGWARFQELARADPALNHGAALAAARQHRIALRLIEELSLFSAPERLLIRLARLALEAAGEAARASPTVLDISQAELASMIAAARQTANKLLAALAAERLVELRFKGIAVSPALIARAAPLVSSDGLARRSRPAES
ncbi:MAG TPA: Crp/Fnr family transcriptional regulator, partial [Terricaulis sp.]|nr:Crp/Fnr family transcriptional regulator [Terricaulis sp.]